MPFHLPGRAPVFAPNLCSQSLTSPVPASFLYLHSLHLHMKLKYSKYRLLLCPQQDSGISAPLNKIPRLLQLMLPTWSGLWDGECLVTQSISSRLLRFLTAYILKKTCFIKDLLKEWILYSKHGEVRSMSIRSCGSSLWSLVFVFMVEGEVILKTQDVDRSLPCGALGILFRQLAT